MMANIFAKPTLTLPFDLRGDTGQVTIYYGPNETPEQWGFSLLDLPFDLSLIRGFPICQATIAFPGKGYQAMVGWIQIITVHESETGRDWTSLDQMPNQRGMDMPFFSFGHLPTLFDAPGPNPPRDHENWLAESFLVACPDVGRTRKIFPILGFKWGYILNHRKPTLLPVEVIPLRRWHDHLPLLKEQCPSWEFFPSERSILI